MQTTLLVTLILVILCVLLHYESLGLLRRLGHYLHNSSVWHHWHISILVCGMLAVHVVEITLFGFVYYWLSQAQDYGLLIGSRASSLSDCLYFSFTTYTSVGYGDVAPSGALRFMAGMEGLTGFVMITWTASFLFLQMRKTWDKDSN